MKKLAPNRKKLRLQLQTVRTLTKDELGQIAGGDEHAPTIMCSMLTCGPTPS